MSANRVAFIMYPVTDLQRAVAFYEETLGFKKAGLESPAWVEFDIDGATFGVGNFEQVGTPGTAQSLAVEIPELAAYRKKLMERGVQVTEPYDLPMCRIAVVSDPDGNQVWLHERKPGRTD